MNITTDAPRNRMRFSHPHGDEMQPGDFIQINSLQGVGDKFIISGVGVGWFDAVHAVLWRWWHEVMWWNPCNDMQLVIGDYEEFWTQTSDEDPIDVSKSYIYMETASGSPMPWATEEDE